MVHFEEEEEKHFTQLYVIRQLHNDRAAFPRSAEEANVCVSFFFCIVLYLILTCNRAEMSGYTVGESCA